MVRVSDFRDSLAGSPRTRLLFLDAPGSGQSVSGYRLCAAVLNSRDAYRVANLLGRPDWRTSCVAKLDSRYKNSRGLFNRTLDSIVLCYSGMVRFTRTQALH